jgi:hypothetical protein
VRKWLSDDLLGQEDQGVEWCVAWSPCEKKGGVLRGAGGVRKGGDGGTRRLLNGTIEGGMEKGGSSFVHATQQKGWGGVLGLTSKWRVAGNGPTVEFAGGTRAGRARPVWTWDMGALIGGPLL